MIVRYLAIVVLLAFSGCTQVMRSGEDEVVARVHDRSLLRKDLAGIFPPNTSHRDSVLIAENFINNWIQQQLILAKASENLTNEELDFSEELEEYKNSLIMYAYETKLVQEYLDTLVTQGEIEQYYERNQQNFELKEPIIVFSYVRVHRDSPEIEIFRKLIRSEDPDDLKELDEMGNEYAEEFWLEDKWVSFRELREQIPYDFGDEERFLASGGDLQILIGDYWYLLKVHDHKPGGSVSPLELEEENIRKIIINNRKLKLKKDLRKDLLKAAIKNNEVVIY